MERLIKQIKIFSVFLLSIASAVVYSQDTPLKKLAFLPQWSPQCQFAGYYIAQEKGIYKKYGLDVTILNGGPYSPPAEFLKNRKTDFATLFLSGGIREKASGADIVNIAQIIQHSALVFVSRKASGISSIKDMNGQKIAIWGSEFQDIPFALLKKNNIDFKLLPVSATVNIFLWGGADVSTVMWYNEFHRLIECGIDPIELNSFFFSNYDGFDIPEDGIYCLTETYNKDPQMCGSFISASVEGWKYAFSHPEEAIDVVMKKMEDAHLPANRAHQTWMLSKMEKLIIKDPKEGCIDTSLDRDDFNNAAKILLDAGRISKMPGFEEFYRGGARPNGR